MNYLLTDNDLKKSSAVLRITGPDANSYLQGQFTQDLRLAEKGPIYGLWLDQKGKVLADSHILRRASNDYLVVAFGTMTADLRARLEAYLIADEVELSDETEKWVRLLVWGEAAAAMESPPHSLVLSSRHAAPHAREMLVPVAHAESAQAALATQALAGSPEQAELSRLRAGLPTVPGDIGPRDLPAEGSLDEVAISFTKGCYLGQEVVARLKNLGQVRRALHLVTGAGAVPAAGAALYQGERKAGELRSGAADGEGFWAMAMLSLVNLDPGAALGLAPGGGDVRILRRV